MQPPDVQRLEQLRQLRDLLVTLYPDAQDVQRLAADSSLPVGALDLSGTALNRWHKLLVEPEKHIKTARLIEIVCIEYPNNPALVAVRQAFLSAGVDSVSAKVESEPPPALPITPNPYRGLEPFKAAHAANYFGRAVMVEKLVAKVATTNFVAVVGPSGSGKSSLVRAGLITALHANALPNSRESMLAWSTSCP